MTWIDLAAPLVLFAMMGVVGLELTLEDFRRGARYPDSAENVVGLRVVRTVFSNP